MKTTRISRLHAALVTLACSAASAPADPTVTVRVVPFDEESSVTIKPGNKTTVKVIATIAGFDPLLPPGAELGSAGIHGFAGEIVAVNASNTTIPLLLTGETPYPNDALLVGAVAPTQFLEGGFVRLAGGRGTDKDVTNDLGPVPGSTSAEIEIWYANVAAPLSITDGTCNLEFRGDVVLVVGDSLWKYSTSSGVRQILPDSQPALVLIGCTPDLTTTNTNPQDPGYGNADGTLDGSDLSYFVEFWLAESDPAYVPSGPLISDFTTTNSNPGTTGYGIPDGQVDGNDLSYYVEIWLAGCL